MVSGLILAWGGVGWGGFSVVDILNQWANAGVFSYVLPFLLVFGFVYGVLSKTKILGENIGVNMVIALAAGGLSLVGDFLPRFAQSIMPFMGMGISILLAAIILGGLFLGDDDLKWVKYVIFGIGIAVFVVVVLASLSDYNFAGNYFWQDYGSSIVVLVLIVAAIVFMTKATGKAGKP